MRNLVTHVGTGHRWSTLIVSGRLSQPPPYEPAPAPADPGDWPDWLRAGADDLLAAVQDAGADCPVWTWQADRTAGFWVRKMLHDEVIHRFDVELAQGRTGTLSAELAADGIDDWLTTLATMSPPGGPKFDGLAGTGETLHVHATDTEGEWLVRRTPAGVAWERGHARADVAVRGPVRALLLVLNRRLGPAHVEVLGDHVLFDHWLDHSEF